ncbi:hypothetical protein HYV83_01715 [Candidatus Woesearchaeota archaeon]|nr:hypothetical protein [Candidatus Woesearchaeota archaeon]
MRSRDLLVLLLFIFLISAVPAHAQQQFKLFESPFMQAFGNWLTTTVQWPPIGQDKEPVTPLAIILVSIALFSIILAVVRTRIAIFQDDRVRHLATWLALPIVGISVTGTHFVPSIWDIVGFGSDITPIILFILLILFAIMLTVRGIGASGIRGGPIGEAIGQRAHQAEEAVAGRIAGQEHGEEQRLAREAQLFQQLDSLEGAGVRDAETLEGYINELINVLGRGQSVRQIREGVNERLTRLNPAFLTLLRINARATALDTELDTLIRTETTNLQRLMRTVRQRQITPAGGAAAAPVPRADATIMTRYITDMTRRLQDARANAQRISRDRPALGTLETQLRARLNAGFAALGVPGRDADRLRNARTEFIAARGVVSQLIARMHEIELAAERIRNDLRAEIRDVNAEDHLARAGI